MPKPDRFPNGGLSGVVETLEALAALLSYFGRAEIRFRTLRFWPGRAEEGTDVAQYRAGWDAVILLPIFDGSVLRERARNLRKGEDVAKVASEIIHRTIGLPMAA